MTVISQEILDEAIKNKSSKELFCNFTSNEGQKFLILTEEQLNLVLEKEK